MTKEIISDAESKFDSTIQHLTSELATIRTGQTSPSLIEDLSVTAYDAEYTLKELAALSIPEANVILIQPWDHSVVEAIERAINTSSIGIQPAVDGTNIRLVVPALSQERRDQFVKQVGLLAEDARVAVRNIRQEKMKSIDGLEEDGKISEDERDRAKKEIQQLVDTINTKIDDLKERKTESIQAV